MKKIMTIDDKIGDEKLQCDIDREFAKTSTLSSGKIDKHDYFKREKTLPFSQSQITDQAKFPYSKFTYLAY